MAARWFEDIATPTRAHITRERLEERLTAFQRSSFDFVHDTNKLALFRAAHTNIYVYLDKGCQKIKVVVDPSFLNHAEMAARGRGRVGELYHNSNMRMFPERKHAGAKATRCGYPVRFETNHSLEAFLNALSTAR